MNLTGALHLTGLLALGLLTACGGGGGSSDPSDANNTSNSGNLQVASEDIQIVGAGIKGPLAFADAKVFALDPSFPGGYDKNSPIATAITDQYAQITGLSVPGNIKPPYVLTIGGENTIDLNTGERPVIATLVTMINEDMLKGNKSVYATPLTTLAFHMARHTSDASTSADGFVQHVMTAATKVSQNFAIDQTQPIDIHASPLLIDDTTDTASQQKEAVFHRASLEAFAAKAYELSRGDGLHATYFSDMGLSQAALDRIDATVDFDWGLNAPDTIINAENFSVRWSGLVQPEYSENYAFYTLADDGVRLWIDGKLIIDQWSDHPATEYQAAVSLTAGKKYSIVMEYYENKKNAVAKLMWSSASQPKEVIAKEYLYSVDDPGLLEDRTTDNVIDRLALDLQSDNVIDNAANGSIIGGIDPTVINQDSMKLSIPNSPYNVEDTIALMEDERVLIGTNNGPEVQVAEIGFGSESDTGSTDTGNIPDPVVTDPVETDPVVTDPVVTDPVVTDPVVTDPVVTDPVVTDPVVTDPVVTDPVVTDPVETDPVVTDPVVTDPVVTDPVETDPVETDPVVTDPVVPDPVVPPEPAITFSTTYINFGNINVGEISDPVPLTLTNTGSAPLSISSVATSAEFTQTNDCNDYVQDGNSCTISLRFIPVAAGEINGSLTISGNTSDGSELVTLSGTANSAPKPVNSVLHVDFENRSVGLYKDADLRTDFQVGQQGYNDTVHGPDWNSTFIVDDPAGSGRGNVLRVTRTEGRAGSSAKSGGMRFRADVPPADEYYFSYDTFVPSSEVGGYDFWWPLQEKQPALINGTLRDASHATGSSPEVDGITGFNSRTQFLGHNVYGRGEGTGETKPIDAYDYLPEYFWDIVDPKAGATNKANGFQHPRGRWIRIEQRVKMNTADAKKADNPSVDLKDGSIEVWVTDEALGWRGKKVLTQSFKFRFVNTMKIDGIFMYDHYGGRPDDTRNQPPQNQSRYYDNFIVSSSPITH